MTTTKAIILETNTATGILMEEATRKDRSLVDLVLANESAIAGLGGGSIADQRVMGNVSGGLAAPAALTQAQVRSFLGLGSAALVATSAFDAAGLAAAAQAASQPLDSDLTAIAALTTTAYGRAFLALADLAAVVALGLVDLTTAQKLTNKRKKARVTTATITTNHLVAPATDLSDIIETPAITAALTIDVPSGQSPDIGDILQFHILNDNTGGYAITWGAGDGAVYNDSVTQALPTTTGTASKYLHVVLQRNHANTKWTCQSVVDGNI